MVLTRSIRFGALCLLTATASSLGKGPFAALLDSAFQAPLMNIRVFIEFEDVEDRPMLGKLHYLDIGSTDSSPLTVYRILSDIHSFLQSVLPEVFWNTFSIKEKAVLLSTLPRGLYFDLIHSLQWDKGEKCVHNELDLYSPWVTTIDIYGRKREFAGLSWVGKGPAGHEFTLHVK